MRSCRPAHACCCREQSASTPAMTMLAPQHPAQVRLLAQQYLRCRGLRSISESA